jgi:ATP-dependent Lhr-like helicase
MESPDKCSTLFHPLIAEWFQNEIGIATDVQAAAWPKIASGEHVLAIAPTGTGKTLTAFLWALNQLITGQLPSGLCSVLYISPLKALNNDIRRNLLGPLGELRRLFHQHGRDFPEIRVLTRSGDTPPEERRRMQRRPPEILITTPESLNLMLSSHGGLGMLGDLKCVILDEIHAVIDSKRGAHLMSAVERLVPLSGEFQRIALSATVHPPELVEEFVGGYRRLDGDRYELRRITIVQSDAHKIYDVRVRFSKSTTDESGKTSIWPSIVDQCRDVINENRSTLIFTNSRRLAETLTWKINADQDELLAYSHHGALSKEIRHEVEQRLKAGDLKAIVATSSLEMGIDIGALDEVLLIQSPPAVSSAIQRVGRAGHRVGETSRAVFYPTHPQDLLQAAVLAKNLLRQNIEETKIVRCPLDVLAQVIISITGTETRDIDDLFAEIRRSCSFHDLTRERFDLVLNMLAGRYAETRIRALRARVSIDRLDNTVAARPGALQDIYFSGGTIPDRGYYRLRHAESGSLIGELDEEYVWEAAPGQTMSFGAQNWRIERITHNDVFVTSFSPSVRQAPFWKGEEMNRDFHLSQEIADFLEDADARLDDPEFAAYLQNEYCLDADSAEELIAYLKRQKEDCGLPHRHRIVIEHVSSGIDGSPANQVVIHTCWGGCVNRPFAMALAAAWQEKFGADLVVFPSDDAVYIQSIEGIEGDELLSLVTPSRLRDLLRKKLEGSGFFGARFREAAGRALLITKRRMGERMPLWVSRLQSKNLLESVLEYGDFPILLETWRTCLQDEFDLENLERLLVELETGAITWSETRHELPSPFAQTMSWRQINQYMYADDTPTGKTRSQLRSDLLREVVFTPGLRPSVPKDIVERFVVKRQRLAEGYAPQSARDLLDWVKERLLIPLPEWQSLLQAIQRDHGLAEDELLLANAGKLTFLQPDDRRPPLVAAVEQISRTNAFWDGDADENIADILSEWLRFYGPITTDFIENALSLTPSRLACALEDLEETQRVISGSLSQGSDVIEICDSENFEILLRMARAGAVPDFQPLPSEALPLFVAHHQGLCKPGESVDDLMACLESLSGYESRAELWEEAILPARIHPYDTSRLDTLMQEGRFHWFGAGKGRVGFCIEGDLDIVQAERSEPCQDDLLDILSDEHARYGLQSLATKTGTGMQELTERLWAGVWNGIVSNDTMAALRKGILNDFKLPNLQETTRYRTGRVGRSSSSRFIGAMPLAGNWYRLPEQIDSENVIENEERNKDRVRLLLERYGILFRELLQNESAQFQWKNIFRALRLMELSGEVLGGCFFHGIPGLQFISRRAFHTLRKSLPEEAVWWLNACDPVSLCGIQLDAFKGQPRRVPGNYIVYRGREVVAVITRNGKELTFLVEPNDDRFQEYLAPVHNLLQRSFRPERHLVVETINNEPAPASSYVDALSVSLEVVRDFNRLFISKRR